MPQDWASHPERSFSLKTEVLCPRKGKYFTEPLRDHILPFAPLKAVRTIPPYTAPPSSPKLEEYQVLVDPGPCPFESKSVQSPIFGGEEGVGRFFFWI